MSDKSPPAPSGPRRLAGSSAGGTSYAQKVEGIIAGLKADIQDRDARIAALDRDVAERDDRISSLTEQLDDQRRFVSEREERNVELARRRYETINQMEAKASEERKAHAAALTELDEKRSALATAEAELKKTRQSKARNLRVALVTVGAVASLYAWHVHTLKGQLGDASAKVASLTKEIAPFKADKDYAAKVISDAKAKAEDTISTAQYEADRLVSNARAEVSQVESERDSISSDLARLRSISRRELALDNAIPSIISDYQQMKSVLRSYVEKWGVAKGWTDEMISCVRSAAINKSDDYIAKRGKAGFDDFKYNFENSVELCISEDDVEKEFLDTFFYVENNTFEKIKIAYIF